MKGKWLRQAVVLLTLAGASTPGDARGQAALSDSLLNLLRQAPADTTRARLALQLAQAYERTDTTQQGSYLRQALRLSRAAHDPYGLGNAYLALALVAGSRGDDARYLRGAQEARRLFARLQQQAPAPRNLVGLARTWTREAFYHQKLGNFPAAARALQQAIGFAGQAGQPGLLLLLYANMGSVFATQNQPREALKYWRKGLTLVDTASIGPQHVGLLLMVAQLHIEQREAAPARRYLNLARTPALAPGGEPVRGQYLAYEARYETEFGTPARALPLLNQALALARQMGNALGQQRILLDLAQAETKRRNYGEARRLVLESMALPAGFNMEDHLLALALLADAEARLGRPAEALRVFRRRVALKDSVADVAVKNQINFLEAQFESKNKEQKIKYLQQSQQLQQAQLSRQQTYTLAALGMLALLLCAGGLGLLALRSRRQVEQQLRQLQARKIQELEQRQQLLATEAMLRGQEEERGRLARDLHDGLGGMLSSVKYYLGSVRSAVVLPDASAQLFNRSLDQLDSSIRELRRVARDMMPEALLQFGLVPALRDMCFTVGQSQQQQVQFQAFGLEERLPQRTEVVVYRLVQELLNNVLKHAQARQVIVQLVRNGRQVQVVVEDDGRGFDASAARTGVGLRSIQARVDYLRGTLDLHTAPGQGTTVTIDFNLPGDEK